MLLFIFLCIVAVMVCVKRSFSAAQSRPDWDLIAAYKTKPAVTERTVLVVQDATSISQVEELLRNVLLQTVRVDRIVLIAMPSAAQSGLVDATCVVQMVGGLPVLFKESDRNTTFLFVFPHAFSYFADHTVVERLDAGASVSGVVKIRHSDTEIDLHSVIRLMSE